MTLPSRPWTLAELEEYVAELGPELRETGVANALADAVEMLRTALRDRADFAEWVVCRTPDGVDHACAECLPAGPVVIAGFQCVRAILPHLPYEVVFDPCAGRGALLFAAHPEGDGRGIEIDPAHEREARVRGLVVTCADALAEDVSWHSPPLIVMNPPFGLAEAFVRRALVELHPRGTVAALLRLGFLASRGRSGLHAAYPSDVYVLPRRPSFTPDGKTDSSDYAWLVWGPGRGGRWQVLEVEDSAP